MRKTLLASTCAIAFAAAASLTFGAVSYGQGLQPNDEKSSADKVKPGSEHSQAEKPRQSSEQGAQDRAKDQNAQKRGAEGDRAKEQSAQERGKDGAQDRTKEQSAQEPMKDQSAKPAAAAASPDNRPKAATEDSKMKHNPSNATNENGARPNGEKPQKGAASGAAGSESRTGETPRDQRGGADKAAGAKGAASQGNEADAGRARSQLDQRQASDLRGRLAKHAASSTASVHFNARIGAPIPETVQLQQLPSEIVVDYPEFRGYDYVMVGDEIVIVDPHSRGVVQVVGGTEGRAAAETGSMRRFSQDQGDVIRQHVHRDRSARIEFDEHRMARVPDTVVLEPLPDEVVTLVPDVRDYRYFIDSDDHIVVVDPSTNEVVDVID
jgi:hypothetical protein